MADLEPQDPYGGQPYYPQQPYYPPQYGNPAPYPSQPGHPPQYQYGYPYAYPYPPAPPTTIGRRRPGTTTAAAIIGWITAGLLVIASTVLFAGSSASNDLGTTFGVDTSWTSEFIVDGIIDLICAGLLVAGGIWLADRKPAGQIMLTVANLVVAADSVYWVARFDSFGGLLPFAVVFGALAIVGTALAWTADTRRWLEADESSKTLGSGSPTTR